jgi:exodeoxyribonuclease III
VLPAPSITGRLIGTGVDREVRGWEKAIDHSPTWIEISGPLLVA